MRIGIKALILLSFFCAVGRAEETETTNPTLLYPERYVKITDWSFYVAWGGEAIIHHVTIENTSNIAYRNIVVRVRYYSGSYSNAGTQVGGETGILPVLVPPHSRKTYLEGGTVLGAGSNVFHAGDIEVLGAVPVSQ
jgi:hypothetical protein